MKAFYQSLHPQQMSYSPQPLLLHLNFPCHRNRLSSLIILHNVSYALSSSPKSFAPAASFLHSLSASPPLSALPPSDPIRLGLRPILEVPPNRQALQVRAALAPGALPEARAAAALWRRAQRGPARRAKSQALPQHVPQPRHVHVLVPDEPVHPRLHHHGTPSCLPLPRLSMRLPSSQIPLQQRSSRVVSHRASSSSSPATPGTRTGRCARPPPSPRS